MWTVSTWKTPDAVAQVIQVAFTLCYYVDYNSLYSYITTSTPGQTTSPRRAVAAKATTTPH